MYRKLLYIIIVFLMIACSGSKSARKSASQMEAAPAWVKERPVTSMYYSGIAKVNKITYPDNYHEVAKKIALNDLASDISVNIQSNSIVSSYEDNAGFQSEFTRYIQMEMTKDLAGYQMQGSFETDDRYMVYYRLSKVKWAQIQAERKEAAVDRAKTIFFQGQKEEKELNYTAAIKSYLNALLELKKYWNESVFYETNGQQKRLDLEIRESLIRILGDIQLVVQPKLVSLSYQNHFKGELSLKIVNSKSEMLPDFPIRINYRKVSIPFQTTIFSGTESQKLEIVSVKYKPNDLFAFVEVEKEKILQIKMDDKKLLKFVSDAFQINPQQIQIDYKLPKIFIASSSKKSSYYHHLKSAVQQTLGKQGYLIVNDEKNADLLFKVSVHESSSNVSSQVKSAYLSYSIEVQDRLEKSILYTYSSSNYKGVDYSFQTALEKSYIKAAEDINDSSFNNLFQAISD